MDDRVIFVTRPCLHCHRTGIVDVDRIMAIKYMNGASLHNCFGDEKPEVREQILTGVHPECWKVMFGHGE
jgi:hypothetical protein